MRLGKKLAGMGIVVAILALVYMAVTSLTPVTVVEETVTVQGFDYRLYILDVKEDQKGFGAF